MSLLDWDLIENSRLGIIELGKISCHSPIAKALIGNEEGDEITVKAPKGDILYEIIEVQYI